MASRPIYASSSGDTWDLVRDEDDRVSVTHKANLASGGKVTVYDLEAFLTQGRGSAEWVALIRLIGSLVGPA